MSDENENVVESSVVVESDTTETEAQVTRTPKTLPADQEWNKVEFNDAATQKRFNRMYAQQKANERIQAQLAEDNAKLVARLDAMENAAKHERVVDSVNKIKAARRTAILEGNLELADELDEQLYEARQAKNKPTEEKNTTDDKAAMPQIPTVIQERIVEWIAETDDDGEVLRPYAQPDHPKYEQFKGIVAGILADKGLAEAILTADDAYSDSVSSVFDKVDRAMHAVGLGKIKKSQPAVLSPSSKVENDKGTKLTMEQIAVAKKMYKGDPDPIGRYRKALGKV